jgi:ATP-dependent Lhr-like helicase
VRAQAWPDARNADEMHEALMGIGTVTDADARANAWLPLLQSLAKDLRATHVAVGEGQWWAAERLPQCRRCIRGDAPPKVAPPNLRRELAREEARSRCARAPHGRWPDHRDALATRAGLPRTDVDLALPRWKPKAS